MSLRVTGHAVDRYIERFAPALDYPAAHAEITRLLSGAPYREGTVVAGDIAFRLRCGLVTTCVPVDGHLEGHVYSRIPTAPFAPINHGQEHQP